MGLIKKAIWGTIIISILYLGLIMDAEAGIESPVAWWSLDNISYLDLSGNGHTLSTMGTLTNPVAFLNNGSGIDAEPDRLYTTNASLRLLTSFSTGCMMQHTSLGGDREFISTLLGANGYAVYFTGGSGAFYANGGGCSINYGAMTTGPWYLVTLVYTSTNNTAVMYVNTTIAGSDTTCTITAGATNFTLGHRASDAIIMDGILDECYYYNYSLNSTEVGWILTNITAGQRPMIQENTTINITATDFYTQANITSFNATINWTNGTSIEYESTSGYVYIEYTKNESENINITIENSSYTTRTITNEAITANTSNELEYELVPTAPYYLTIIARNYLNNTNLTDVIITVNGTGENQTSNPFQHDINEYINITNTWSIIQVNITDNTYLHRNYTGTINVSNINREFYIVMEGNQLILAFQQNGAGKSTTGWIADQNMSHNFTNTTLLIVQQSLDEGKVEVVFNNISNWSQYYEYVNDYELHINETLEILTKADWYAYIEVVDYTDEPIKDANIYAYFSIPTSLNGSAVTHKLYTRRLTLDDEPTLIWGDTDTAVKIVVSKEGYEQATVLIPFADESYEKTSPLTFRLKESEEEGRDRTWLFIPRIVRELNNGLNATITAYDKTLVAITTDWRTAQGLGTKTLTKDSTNRYSFSLVCDTDYACGDDNVSIQIYIDGTLYDNITTSEYQNITERLTGTEISGLDTRILNPIMLIGLILLTAMAGSVFKNEEVGEITFKAGTIILAAISLSFAWVAIIFALEYAIKGVSKYISE